VLALSILPVEVVPSGAPAEHQQADLEDAGEAVQRPREDERREDTVD